MLATRPEDVTALAASHPIPDPTPLENYYAADSHLQSALRRYYRDDPTGWQEAETLLTQWGATCAKKIAPLYEVVERHGPTLYQYNRRGERVDELEFHPGYHEIGKMVYGLGMAEMCNRPDPASQLLKFAAMYLYGQAEGSISCPVSMTDILARVLNKYGSPELRASYIPRLTSRDYDQLYTGAMFMTEKTGGSDVGATTTIARQTSEGWELSGDKWFCSNVGADLILTLARPEGAPGGTRGLGLFLVPRLLPDGRRNSYVINRLKDKLGTRGMASGEVTLQGATAYLIEPLERGFVMMMEMVNGTRLYSGVGGASSLRRGLVEAIRHTRARVAFGKPLAEQPLIAEKLADMVADNRATTSLALATAHRLDLADRRESQNAPVLSRLLISLLKRYATDHGVQGAQAALELRGGNGYIEDWPNARLLRDAYVNIIWEGGINMVAFDVLRTLEREAAWPVFVEVVQEELSAVTNSAVIELRDTIQDDLSLLEKQVERIMGQTRAGQEIAAPLLSETMAALYAVALLTAEADFGLQTQPADLRPLQVARRYQTRFLRPMLAKLAILDGPSPEAADLIGIVD